MGGDPIDAAVGSRRGPSVIAVGGLRDRLEGAKKKVSSNEKLSRIALIKPLRIFRLFKRIPVRGPFAELNERRRLNMSLPKIRAPCRPQLWPGWTSA